MKGLLKKTGGVIIFCLYIVSISGAKTGFKLFDSGTEGIVDYSQYGTFEGIKTDKYKYVIEDRKGLSRAVGEGIYPNDKTVRQDPEYQKFLSEGKLDGSRWSFLGSNAQANFYKWATAPESPAVKLFYVAQNLEKAGLYKQAIKAYYALVVHFPRSASWAQEKTFVWYLAPVALDSINNICKNHPELELKLIEAEIKIKSFDDTDLDNDIVTVNPGKLVKYTKQQRKKEELENGRLIEVKEKEKKKVKKVEVTRFTNGHYQLRVKGKPYIIKGITYGCTPVGQSAELGTQEDWTLMDYNKNGKIDGPYDSWVDKNKNNKQDADEPVIGDFQLLKEMGCNTIRIYHSAGSKKLLRKLYKDFGIMCLMGDFMGMYGTGSGRGFTDYTNAEQRTDILYNLEKKVLEFKDEPYLLLWVLGNENNYGVGNNYKENPTAYYQFINQAAELIHRLDPEHPVAVCMGDEGDLELFAAHCPAVDIFGCNAYRGSRGFGGLWEKVKKICDKPVLITEYGCPAYYEGKKQKFAEKKQAEYLVGCWQDIVLNLAGSEAGNAMGGILYEWIDEWWLSGNGYDPKVHDTASRSSGPFPDGWGHSEWFGITSQGDGEKSPYLRQLRKAYYVHKEIWNKKIEKYSANENEKKLNKSEQNINLKLENKIIENITGNTEQGKFIDNEKTKKVKNNSPFFPQKAKVIIFPLLGVQVLLVFKLLKSKKGEE